jgi:hypothetical protein
MAHTILASAMGWLRGVLDASTYVSSLPGNGTISAMDAVVPNHQLLRPLSVPVIRVIWENKTLTAGIVLGLVIILTVNYTRSPWRKLPPSPPRLPVLGNALQLRNKSWLLSKDCKERFGEFSNYNIPRVMLRCVYGKLQERLCTLTGLVSP